MTDIQYCVGRDRAVGGEARAERARKDKEPFLSLLEQLTENEYLRGGLSDLDFFWARSSSERVLPGVTGKGKREKGIYS